MEYRGCQLNPFQLDDFDLAFARLEMYASAIRWLIANEAK